MTRKPRSHIEILIYRTWAFVKYKAKRVCLKHYIVLSLLFSALLQEVFLRVPRFFPLLKI